MGDGCNKISAEGGQIYSASNVVFTAFPHFCSFREEPLMIWGGRAKAGKKIQRLLGQEKKSSMASCRGKKNSTQILCLGAPPPDH